MEVEISSQIAIIRLEDLVKVDHRIVNFYF